MFISGLPWSLKNSVISRFSRWILISSYTLTSLSQMSLASLYVNTKYAISWLCALAINSAVWALSRSHTNNQPLHYLLTFCLNASKYVCILLRKGIKIPKCMKNTGFSTIKLDQHLLQTHVELKSHKGSCHLFCHWFNLAPYFIYTFSYLCFLKLVYGFVIWIGLSLWRNGDQAWLFP